MLGAGRSAEFDQYAQLASELLRAPVAVVTLLDSDRHVIESHVGLPDQWATWRTPPGPHVFGGHEVRTGQPLVVADLRVGRQTTSTPLDSAIDALGLVSYAGVPLLPRTPPALTNGHTIGHADGHTNGLANGHANGHAMGSLCVADRQPRTWSAEELRILGVLAIAAAAELEARTLAREAVALAKALDLQKDQFLGSISHDLKNPLTAIAGTAQLLELQLARKGSLPAKQVAEACATIRRAVARVVVELDELLDVARLRPGQQPMELTCRPTDLVALAREKVADHARSDDHNAIELIAREESLVGTWDAARLERALANVIGNAAKYSPEGGPITVTVRREGHAGSAGAWAVLSVADRGIGIPAADLPRVFDRFHRASNVAGEISGSGIGLADVQQVIQRHGGRVDVESVEGEGSTFTVWLPLRPAPTGK